MRKVLTASPEDIETGLAKRFNSPLLTWPLLGSPKFDGWRLTICDGKLWTRNGKLIHNLALPAYLASVVDFCLKHHYVPDGELWCPGVTFQEIQSLLASYDKPINMPLVYNVFDMLTHEEWLSTDIGEEAVFSYRVKRYSRNLKGFEHVTPVPQTLLYYSREARTFYECCIENGYEGCMLRDPDGWYKHGKATLREGLMFKFKKWSTATATIVGFKQGKRMKEEVRTGLRERDHIGVLKHSNLKEDYEEVHVLGSVKIELKCGITCYVKFAKEYGGPTITWEERKKFLNRRCKIRYQAAGVKIRPRTGLITRLV